MHAFLWPTILKLGQFLRSATEWCWIANRQHFKPSHPVKSSWPRHRIATVTKCGLLDPRFTHSQLDLSDSRLEWQRQSTVLHRSTCNNLVSELEYLWPICVAFISMKIKWWFMNWFIDAAVLVQCGLLSSMQVCKSTSLSPIWQTCILSPNSLNVSQLFTSICELPSLA